MLGLFGAAVSQPAVFYASDPVFPNETVLATTGNTDKYSSVNIAQLPNTAAGSPLNRPPALPSLNPASVIQASGTSVKFVVPPTFQKGAYVFQVSTSSGVSTPQYLNVPHVMFIQGDMGDAGSNGGWLEVHGRTVGLPGGTPRMALVQNNTIVAFLKPDPNDAANTIYRQRFLIPTTTPPGVYACYVHNGYGGPNGWTKYDTFVNAPVNTVRIVPRRSWPTATVHLAAPTGGYDDNLFASAFAQLPNGGILNMAAGTYKLSKQLVLPNHLSLRGTSAQTTTLNWVTDPLSGSSYLPLITAKTIGTQPVTFAPIRGTFELSRFNVVA
ncbi:MAG TPA: hypothetical protein VG944_08540, partial [Fimbriimonas sp.]|nr:hypothetical protein [Fimbriimonas sp.]